MSKANEKGNQRFLKQVYYGYAYYWVDPWITAPSISDGPNRMEVALATIHRDRRDIDHLGMGLLQSHLKISGS